jgi:competence protein ComEC
MLIAAFFISISLCWFYFGLITALVLSLGGSLLFAVLNWRIGGIAVAVSLILLFSLEEETTHKLESQSQHINSNLSVCFEQVVSIRAQDYSTVVGSVVDQPKHLSLRKIKISAYNGELADFRNVAGKCIKGEFRLRQPIGKIIPGAFKADEYYFANQVDALATVVSLDGNWDAPDFADKLYNRVANELHDTKSLSIWSALTLGWSQNLDLETKHLLTSNQLMHLFVISGMHLGFIALMITAVVRVFIKPFAEKLTWTYEYQFAVVIVCLIFYLSCIGFPIPAVRALIMLVVPLVLIHLGLSLGISQAFSLAVILITIWKPECWLSLSPWLSFSAVGLILTLIHWDFLGKHHWFVKLLGYQAILSMMAIPWSIYAGFPVNIFSLFINLIVTPLVGFILMPLCFLSALTPNTYFNFILDSFVTALSKVLTMSEPYSFSLLWVDDRVLILTLVFITAVVWFRNVYASVSVFFSFVVMLALFIEQKKDQDFTDITLFDVGHGQAILIENNEGNYLLDTGGGFSEGQSLYDVSLQRVLPRLDGLIISHSDSDHSTGYNSVRRSYPDIPVWSGQSLDFDSISKFRNCHESGRISNHLRFIRIPVALRNTDNNHSCVLVFEKGRFRALFTSDADKMIEYYLMQEYSELLPANLVLLGHHGSDSSSAHEWLVTHKDENFAVSTSDRLRPVWPSNRLRDWFQERNLEYLSTARLGTIRYRIIGEKLSVKTWDTAYRKRLIN